MCADKIEITYAMQPDKIINKLYVELVSSIFSIFNKECYNDNRLRYSIISNLTYKISIAEVI